MLDTGPMSVQREIAWMMRFDDEADDVDVDDDHHQGLPRRPLPFSRVSPLSLDSAVYEIIKCPPFFPILSNPSFLYQPFSERYPLAPIRRMCINRFMLFPFCMNPKNTHRAQETDVKTCPNVNARD